MFVSVEPTWRLEWLKKEHRLPEQLENGGSRTFGPFDTKGSGFHVRYDADTDTWELLQLVDTSLEEYARLRGKVFRLADQHRDHMPSDELVALLIQACIETGLATRADIVDSVEFATMLDAADIGRVLAKHRGRDAARHLWWVADDKTYRLH